MNNPFLDVLKRHHANGQSESDYRVSEALDETCRKLAVLLSGCDAGVRQELLAESSSRVRALLAEVEAQPAPVPLTPELREWLRQQFNAAEFLAGVREIEQTGGVELRDFIHELEEAARADE